MNPRDVAAHILAETGVDVLDPAADTAAARAVMRRSFRQLAGTVLCGMTGALALICIVLSFAPGAAAIAVRVTFGVAGLLIATGAVALGVWGWRTSPQYRRLYLDRQQAQQRFFTELGQPWPNAFDKSGLKDRT